MRTMIAVPCMDMVHTLFFVSVMRMRKPEETEITVASSSLVYDSRHILAQKAIFGKFDRVLWLDSDMHFQPDLMEKLSKDLDEGRDFVSALYFTRKKPVKPCVYEICHDLPDRKGEMVPTATSFSEIPEGIFQIEACGFGAVMMTTDLLRNVGALPFFPTGGYGEDLTFCRRAREAGYTLWCDSRIRADHIGYTLIDESAWEKPGACEA